MDSNNYDQKQLRLNYWLVNHREYFKKGLICLIIAMDIILWGYSGYKWFVYLKQTYSFKLTIKEMNKNLINWTAIHQRNTLQPLEIINLFYAPAGESRYDLAAQVNNPNPGWLVPSLEYKFLWDDKEARQTAFMLAKEEKIFLTFNAKSETAPKDLNIEFTKINWKRITPKLKIPDFRPSDFIIKNIFFDPSLKRVSFSAYNSSAYSFWTVDFKITVWRDKILAAANKISIDKFLSGEEKLIEIPFLQNFSSHTRILVEPEVNILDPDIFIPLKR